MIDARAKFLATNQNIESANLMLFLDKIVIAPKTLKK